MTGRGKTLAAVTPAAAGLTLAATLTAVVVWRPAALPASALAARAEQAVHDGDDATALLTQQHLMAVEPDRPGHALAMALTLDRMRRRGEAVAVLATVAPADRVGYAPAHLRLAEWAVEQRVMTGVGDAATLAAARRHAEAAAGDETLATRARQVLQTLDGLAPTTRPGG